MKSEVPVFFDKTGRRWKLTKLTLVVFSALSLWAIGFLFQKLNTPATVDRSHLEVASSQPVFPVERRSPTDLAYTLPTDMPILGTGVFLRVSSVKMYQEKFVAVDVYSGRITKTLSDEEKGLVGKHQYVIEKYGVKQSKHIVLTFDDGPHPIYTPQILDILSAEAAHSTFFPIGSNVVKNPDISKRAALEGHDVSNHTFGHVDLDLVGSFKARQEINQTQRILTSVTGVNSSLFRIPYGGNDDESIVDDRRAVLEAQQQGYVLVSYDIDTKDWEFKTDTQIVLPELDGSAKVFLLHDGGGDRSQTVAYLRALIKKAKAAGYEFTSISRLFQEYNLSHQVKPSKTDKAAFYVAQAVNVWSKKMIHILFFISVTLMFFSVVIGILTAELQILLVKPRRRRNHYYPLVTVVIPAFNEEKVLNKTVSSVLRSYYRNLEVVIVDDGSKDDTWRVVEKLMSNKLVHGYRQRNRGKARAINKGIKESRGEIIISIDADTIFLPSTVGKMVRYFYYPEIGAVAGVVKVGNVNSWITRWQALEYITSINIERASQAYMRSIAIAPGACSAWRKAAIKEAGGYSNSTMAEDCDLTLALHKAGYKVVQDMKAIAYTECPETIRDLAKQRFRWLFGTIQSFWKHRDMIFRPKYGWLGLYVIPKSVLGILMQLLFTPLLLFVAIGNITAGNTDIIIFYTCISFIVLLFTAGAGLLLAKERPRFLAATPAFRLVYGPLRSILLYATALAAFGGLQTGWNKVVRHGTVR